VSHENAGASVIGRALCAMGLACALAGILLEGVWVEIPGIALGAAGYWFAARSDDMAGQVLGVAAIVLCPGTCAPARCRGEGPRWLPCTRCLRSAKRTEKYGVGLL
jgi:hypothetical protein